MTIEKNIWADIQDGVTQGLAAAELVNDNKRAVNEVIDVVNGLGTASTMTNASGGSTLGTASTKNVATSAQAFAGTVGVLTDAAGVHAAFKQYGYGGVNPSNFTLNCNDLGVGSRNSWDVTESIAVSLNLPVLGGSSSTPRSWHVECFGRIGRLVQEATEVFGSGGTTRGRTFIRVKHDSMWYPWVEVMTAANLTSTNFDSNLGRIVKVGDYGLGRLDNVQFAGVGLNPDDYRVGGFYVGSFSIFGSNKSGFLSVHAGPSSNVCAQEFIDYDRKDKYFRAQQGGVWGEWQELYHTGSILGTVSQSGGVPTGAILERGSNANGEFVKYADGTMICYKSVTITGVTWGGANGQFSADYQYAMPVNFVGQSYQWGSTGNRQAVVCPNSGSGSQWDFRLGGFSTSVTDNPARLMAIGRWY